MQDANLATLARWARALKLRREQPRDGRNRFLSWAWLAQAETFTADDQAWFKSRAA